MAKLIGMTGDFKDREYPLEQGETSIGRKTDNTVLLDNPTISSHHCAITLEGSSCAVRDLDSTNGTRVNSRDVQESPLRHKDILQLGSVEFLIDAPELASAPSSGRYTDADVEMATGAMLSAPQDFNTISPFGAPPKERKGTWYILLIVVGIITLAVFVFYALMLMGLL